MNENKVEGAVKSAAGKAQAAYGKVAGDAKAEAAGQGRDALGAAQRVYGQSKDAISDLGESASEFAKQAADAGSDYVRDGSRAVASTVRNQPVGALLVAGALGFALAIVMTRQPRRRQRWPSYR